MFSIKTAAEKTGYNEMYIRRLLKDGKLAGVKDEKGRWEISDEVLNAFQSRKTNRASVRTYVIHVQPDDLAKVQDSLKELGIELVARYQHKARKAEPKMSAQMEANIVQATLSAAKNNKAHADRRARIKAAKAEKAEVAA